LTGITTRRGTYGTHFVFGKHSTTAAMPNPANSVRKRRGQSVRPIPVSLKQVKGNSLRRLLSDARHTPKAVDQANEKR